MFNKLNSKLLSLALLLSPTQLLAALPTGTALTGGTTAGITDSPIQLLQKLFSSGIGTATTIIAAIVILGGAWQIWSSFVQSREKGDWKGFAITASIAVVLMVGVVFIAVFANTTGATFTAQ